MITAWPLDDADYTAREIGAFAGTRTRGVFAAEDCFHVTAEGGFNVNLSGGLAWLQKEKYWGLAVLEPEDTSFRLDVGSGLLDRYVAVCIVLDKTANAPRKILRYGAYSDHPAKPTPRRDAYYDEIIVATVLQKAAAVEITAADIIDERTNEAMCGIMRDGVTGIPLNGLTDQMGSRFEQWFEGIKGQLGTDPAGNLQIQVDDLKSKGSVFTATFRLDGWKQSGSTWTQTAPCEGMREKYYTSSPWVYKTGTKDADDRLRDALSQLEDGYLETQDNQIKATLYAPPPRCDIKLYLQRRAMGVTGNDAPMCAGMEFATSQEVKQMLDEVLQEGGTE